MRMPRRRPGSGLGPPHLHPQPPSAQDPSLSPPQLVYHCATPKLAPQVPQQTGPACAGDPPFWDPALPTPPLVGRGSGHSAFPAWDRSPLFLSPHRRHLSLELCPAQAMAQSRRAPSLRPHRGTMLAAPCWNEPPAKPRCGSWVRAEERAEEGSGFPQAPGWVSPRPCCSAELPRDSTPDKATVSIYLRAASQSCSPGEAGAEQAGCDSPAAPQPRFPEEKGGCSPSHGQPQSSLPAGKHAATALRNGRVSNFIIDLFKTGWKEQTKNGIVMQRPSRHPKCRH